MGNISPGISQEQSTGCVGSAEALPSRAVPAHGDGGAAFKSGVHTTEFWLTVALIVVDTLLGIADVIPATWAVTMSAALAVAYKGLRTAVKIFSAVERADVLVETTAPVIVKENTECGMRNAEYGMPPPIAGTILDPAVHEGERTRKVSDLFPEGGTAARTDTD